MFMRALPRRRDLPTYFVDATNGSDSNSGKSPALAWQTITKVNAASLKSNDRVAFRRGESFSGKVQITWDGTIGNPITFHPYGSGVKPIVNGGNNEAVQDTYGHDYITLDGLDLRSSTSAVPFVVELDDFGGSNGGSNGWTIKNCDIYGPFQIYGSGLTFDSNTVNCSTHPTNTNAIRDSSGAGALLLSHNNIYTNNTISGTTVRGIWWQGKTYQNQAKNNTIHTIGDIGIDADGYTRIQWEHTISGNTIYGCGESGIELESCFNTLVEKNLIYDSGTDVACIHIIAYDTGESGGGYGGADQRGLDCQNKIYTNIIYGSDKHGIMITDAAGVLIRHNTIVGSTRYGVLLNETAYVTGTVMQNNIISQSGYTEVGFQAVDQFGTDNYNCLDPAVKSYELIVSPYTTYTLAQYNTATSNKAANSIEDDPSFTAPGSNNYHLQSDSPCRNVGTDLGFSTDFDGVSRPQETNPTIGAYEYVA